MNAPLRQMIVLTVAIIAATASAAAQAPRPRTPPARAAVMQQGQPAPLPPDLTRSQPVTIEVGTGILLPLPEPASTVLSAEPSIARVQPASPTSLFLMGVSSGHTTIIATSESGAPIVQYDVTVSGGKSAAAPPAPAPNPLSPLAPLSPLEAPATNTISPAVAAAAEREIRRVLPAAQGIRVNAVGGRLLLSGTVPTALVGQQVESIARGYVGEKGAIVPNFLVLGTIQVNVRVRIAEISRSIERQFGFNWQAFTGGSKWKFGTLTGAAASTAGGGKLNPQTALGNGLNQIGAGFTSGATDINGIIDALASDNLVTILAEPNLTAQSGEAASFLAGGEFPVPIATSTGTGEAISVTYKQYGVSLEVVPIVLSPGRVNLRVKPEVSQLSTAGAVSVPVSGGTLTIPAVTVRRAETTVELGSGQSFAIAGLLERTSTNDTTAVPGLGELPVLGALFKSNDFLRGESELVIIVTPYLVKPASSPEAFRLPTDNFKPGTDLDRILLGRQVHQPDGAPLNAGFILK